jgi:hypothetical protein
MLFLATVGVVCNVGAVVWAAEVKPEGTGQAAAIANISDDVAEFLDAASPQASTHQTHLLKTVDLPRLADSSAMIAPTVATPKLISPTLVAPLTPAMESADTPAAEMPLVPLPPSVWTGTAGLLGLGVVKVCRRAPKSLR